MAPEKQAELLSQLAQVLDRLPDVDLRGCAVVMGACDLPNIQYRMLNVCTLCLVRFSPFIVVWDGLAQKLSFLSCSAEYGLCCDILLHACDMHPPS